MRLNTSWALAGNVVYAGCQWAVLVLLVNSLSQADVGEYAYALAITAPIFVLASVRLRNLLATGVASPGDFHDYLTTRLLTTGCALFVSLAVGAVSGARAETLVVIALVAVARSCDALSDICHGLFQRELDMRTAAAGLMLNGLASVLLVRAALAVSQSLLPAVMAAAAGSLIALAVWDLPQVAGMLRLRGTGIENGQRWRQVRALLVRALPLGLSSALGSLQTNLPRYVIASLLGPAPLAVFAAISQIPLPGHLAINAASQAALPLLARDAPGLRQSYQARLYGLVASGAALGLAALVLTMVAGRRVLDAIYGSAYADHAGVLLWLVAAAVVTFISVFLGTGAVARGRFGAQLAVTTVSAVVVGASLVPLVRRFGLTGAAGSLFLGSVVELAAYIVVTIRDLRREAPAPGFAAAALAGSVQR